MINAVNFRVADWFASLNNKMGGDLKKIQTVGDYFVEVWKAVGMENLGDKVCSLLFYSWKVSRLYQWHNSVNAFQLYQ